MEPKTPHLLRGFVDEVRALFKQPLSDDERWRRIAALMPALIESPELRASARSWPEHGPGEMPRNLLFYEDPDYRFVVNGLIKKPHEGTPVHDHAHTWTVSALMEGEEHVTLYRRADDGSRPDFASLEKLADHEVRPGHVDLIPPYVIHEERAGDCRTISMIVRSEKTGSFPQNMFHMVTGRVTQSPGAGQFPYDLDSGQS
jgi:predicted metal-dependent enzyme (double-stranded beta helix superfamily)